MIRLDKAGHILGQRCPHCGAPPCCRRKEIERKCKGCQIRFSTFNSSQKYCKDSCRKSGQQRFRRQRIKLVGTKEKELIAFIIQGEDSKYIAKQFGINERSVKAMLDNLYKSYRCTDQDKRVKLAVRLYKKELWLSLPKNKRPLLSLFLKGSKTKSSPRNVALRSRSLRTMFVNSLILQGYPIGPNLPSGGLNKDLNRSI